MLIIHQVILTIPEKIYGTLMEHLLPKEAEVEEAAMLFVTVEKKDDLIYLIYKDWYPIPPEGFIYQSSGYIELTDEMRAKLIKKAHDLDAALVEFHSHLYPYDACFSWSDRIGFEEFVPHIWWRLKGKPYGAIVVAPSNFDALVWIDGPKQPQALNELHIDSQVKSPTNLSLNQKRRYNDFKKI